MIERQRSWAGSSELPWVRTTEEQARMHSIGIDVGAAQHSVAICRAGNIEAERGVLRIPASRSGFAELDRWIARQGAVEPHRARVQRPLLADAGQSPARGGAPRRGGQSAHGQVLRQTPAPARQERSRRRAYPRRPGHGRPTRGARAPGRYPAARGRALRHAPGARAGAPLQPHPAPGRPGLPGAAPGLRPPDLHDGHRAAQGRADGARRGASSRR